MSTPTQRTMRLIELWGWNHWTVERYNNFSGRRTDLFNIIDIIALTKKGIVGVQSCGTDFSGHRNKLMIDESFNTMLWLRTPKTRLYIIGWRKLKVNRGGKAIRYYPRIGIITLKGNRKRKLKFKELPLDKNALQKIK